MSKEARVAALEALYAAEATGSAPDPAGLSARAKRFVEGVASARAEIDARIASVSRGWRIERMPMVDRCVLRLAVYELTHTDTPPAVIIDEAVELAKSYSTARSGAFVNGVLGAIVDGTTAADPDHTERNP